MIEHDAFEVRFGAAVHSYVGHVSSDLDPVELTHRIATSEPRRRGFTTALAWPRIAMPRLAWTLVLLAALLTALVAGVLMVGSQPVRRLPAVVPVGEVFACPPGSTPDKPGPFNQARPFVSAPMAFDRRAGKLVAVASPDVGPGPVETWVFDVCTNTWTRMHPDREPPAQLRSLVYDADSDLTIGVHSEDWVYPPVTGTAWAYDLQTNTWTELGVAATNEPGFYDPVSGLVISVGNSLDETAPAELWSYDVEADTWTPVRQTTRPEHLGASEYVFDTSVNQMIELAWGGDRTPETRLFDIGTGDWSRSAPRCRPSR